MAAMPFISVGMGVTGALTTKVRPGRIIGVAFLVSSAGALVLTLVHPGNPIVVLLIGAGIAAGGVVAAQSIVGNLVMAAAPAERAGSASALNETGAELGSSLGMALLGSVGAAIYHHKMQTVGASGAPDAAVRAGHETIGGADALAAQFPGPATHALLTTARDAYSSGLHTAAGVGAVVLFLTALYAFRALRDEPVLPAAPKKEKGGKKSEDVVPVAISPDYAAGAV
jgi:DHA2 family multidrug resistance protein-like MFS transporter